MELLPVSVITGFAGGVIILTSIGRERALSQALAFVTLTV
jgi:hypothetical protein